MTLLRIAVVVLGFLAAGVAFLPMRVVFDVLPIARDPISVRHVSGSVWNASLGGVTWGEAELGDFRLRVRPASLLGGKLRVAFTSSGPIASGDVVASPSEVLFLNLNGRVDLPTLASRAPAGSAITVRNAALDLAPSGCERAGGAAVIDGLSDLGVGALEGPISCEAGRLLLSLSPQQGGGRVDILINTAMQGEGAVSARSRDSVLRAGLSAMGFAVEQQEGP